MGLINVDNPGFSQSVLIVSTRVELVGYILISRFTSVSFSHENKILNVFVKPENALKRAKGIVPNFLTLHVYKFDMTCFLAKLKRIVAS